MRVKLASEKTQLRNAKAELSRLKNENSLLKHEREQYRKRATKSEQECAEWKARFDTLLKRDQSSVAHA